MTISLHTSGRLTKGHVVLTSGIMDLRFVDESSFVHPLKQISTDTKVQDKEYATGALGRVPDSEGRQEVSTDTRTSNASCRVTTFS